MIGARTQPCFTPTSTGKLEDWEPVMTTWAHIPVWNCCSMAIKVGGQPNWHRIFQRRSWLTVWNEFAWSTKAIYMSLCYSQHIPYSCQATNIISIVLRPRRNPHQDSWKTRSTTCSTREGSMISASTLPATVRREMPRLLPHSARSPICPYTRIMMAFFHYCGRHLADQHSAIKLHSLLCEAHPPYLMTSAEMLSGPAALLSYFIIYHFILLSLIFIRFCRYSAHPARIISSFMIRLPSIRLTGCEEKLFGA